MGELLKLKNESAMKEAFSNHIDRNALLKEDLSFLLESLTKGWRERAKILSSDSTKNVDVFVRCNIQSVENRYIDFDVYDFENFELISTYKGFNSSIGCLPITSVKRLKNMILFINEKEKI